MINNEKKRVWINRDAINVRLVAAIWSNRLVGEKYNCVVCRKTYLLLLRSEDGYRKFR
jgi:hypothetical protein